jgi:hypothetical protein
MFQYSTPLPILSCKTSSITQSGLAQDALGSYQKRFLKFNFTLPPFFDPQPGKDKDRAWPGRCR